MLTKWVRRVRDRHVVKMLDRELGRLHTTLGQVVVNNWLCNSTDKDFSWETRLKLINNLEEAINTNSELLRTIAKKNHGMEW